MRELQVDGPSPAVVRFQDGLHHVLRMFLNGDFVVPGSPRAALLRPLALRRCPVPWDVFKAPAAAVRAGQDRSLLSAAAAGVMARGEAQGRLDFADAAALLSELYAVLDRLVPATGPEATAVTVLKRYSRVAHARRPAAVSRLAAYVQRALAPHLLGFYLHGSMSTEDFVHYSDIDTFGVVARDVVLDPRALERCAEAWVASTRFLYDHDLLQHHRHYAVTAIDLRSYSPAYLPPEVLRYATAIVGPESLQISVRDAVPANLSALRHLGEELLRRAPEQVTRNAWRLKYFVSSVLMLPLLYLETLGTYCYKKFAFDLARQYFDGTWEAVELASQLRSHWRYRPAVRERCLRAVVLRGLRNPPLFEHLMAHRSGPVPRSTMRWLARTQFFEKTRALSRVALRRLDGAGQHVE